MARKKIEVSYIMKNQVADINYFYHVSYNRWNNAVNCFKNGDYFSAVYLAGYSVECILKYAIWESLYPNGAIAKGKVSITDLENEDSRYKVLWTHQLPRIIEFGNSKNVFKAPVKSDFSELMKWTSEWRYAKVHNITDRDMAKEFLDDIVELSQQLKDNTPRHTKIKVFQL